MWRLEGVSEGVQMIGKSQLTNIVQVDGIQAAVDLATRSQDFRDVGVLSLTRFVLAVPKAHQTDCIPSRAVNLVRNTELNTIDPHIADADHILSEWASGGTAIAEGSVESWRFGDDLVC
jgi:hypothetical protein